MSKITRHEAWTLVPLLTALLLSSLLVVSRPAEAQDTTASQSEQKDAVHRASENKPEDMSLKGDEESTVLESLTVEGEDRIQIEFDRPQLDLHIDGYQIEGLTWGRTMDVVQRREVDALDPMIQASHSERTTGLARPWLRQLRTGSVARFRPEMDGVENWKLTIADSRGDTVKVFTGKGSLPDRIEWDGIYDSGQLALPGLVYSYVLEASDKAGNRRNFVGQGFEVAPYRVEKNGQFQVVLSGKSMMGAGAASRPRGMTDPWILEAASWINQYGDTEKPIEIHVSARNFEMAEAMGEMVRVQLSERVSGSPLRLRVTTEATSDAPQNGVVIIGTEI